MAKSGSCSTSRQSPRSSVCKTSSTSCVISSGAESTTTSSLSSSKSATAACSTANDPVSETPTTTSSSHSSPPVPPLVVTSAPSSCQEFPLLITNRNTYRNSAPSLTDRIHAAAPAGNNTVISSCHDVKAKTIPQPQQLCSSSDTDSSAITITSSMQNSNTDPRQQIDSSSCVINSCASSPDVTTKIDNSVTDCNNCFLISNTPAARKSIPRISLMPPAHTDDFIENSDRENDEGIFSSNVSPADSSDEVVTLSRPNPALFTGSNGFCHQKLEHRRPKQDIGSDEERDSDDSYDFGCSRTESEEEVDDLSYVRHHQTDDDEERRHNQSSLIVNDDDEDDIRMMMSSSSISISSSSDYDSSIDMNSSPLNNVLINGKQIDMTCERYAVLTFDQVARLDHVMDSLMPIHGRGNFPTLEVKLKDLVQVVRSKLVSDGVDVRDIRLNGGAASYVISCLDEKQERSYSDLDLIFAVDLSNHRNFDKVRSAVLDSLLDFLPEGVNKKKMSSCTLKEAYVHKMVKVADGGDRWSLISLCNNSGRDIEIKFVDTMKRQFEFSVDSFQVILDSLLLYYECSDSVSITENMYPTVVGESVYGNFYEALHHLQHRLIATRNPEEIRGGGLLKYCRLQVLGYQPENADEIKNMEKYMCSRFFIDFSDINVQRVKLANYLNTHFHEDDQMKYDYLMILQHVVDASTVCLMGHERRQTLRLIEEFALHFYYQDPHNQLVQPPAFLSNHPQNQQQSTQQPVQHAHQQKTQEHRPFRRHANNNHKMRHQEHGNQSKRSHSHSNICNNNNDNMKGGHVPQMQASVIPFSSPDISKHEPQQQTQSQMPPQTLVLGSTAMGQFYYATPVLHSNNVTYQTAITQSNPSVVSQHHPHFHPHHHHHHHHYCHSHQIPHSAAAHQNYGCLNCYGTPSGHCSISWMPCAWIDAHFWLLLLNPLSSLAFISSLPRIDTCEHLFKT